MKRKLTKALKIVFSGSTFKGEFRGSIFIDRDIHQVLQELEVCEKQTGRFTENKLRPVFRNPGNTVVICNYWQRITQLKTFVLFLKNSNISLKNFFIPIARTRSNAYRLRIGGTSKLAALYPKENLVCKSYGRAKSNADLRKINSLALEADALKLNEKINSIKTPKLIYNHANKNQHQIPAIWLELIQDKKSKKKNRQQLSVRILKSLLEAYEQHGVDFVEFEGIFTDPVTQKNKLNIPRLLENGWNDDEASLIMNAINKVVKSGLCFPKSYIHGDAAVGNCLVNNRGEIFLIDWELFRKDFIMYDVFNLCRSGGSRIKVKYEKWFKHNFPCNFSNSNLEVQEGLFMIRRFFHLNRMYKEWISSTSKEVAKNNLLDRKQKVFSGVNKINNNI